MGICIQSIVHKGPPNMRSDKDKTLTNGWVWLVVRRDPKTSTSVDGQGQPRGHDWHIQGIASSEEIAIRMCSDEHHIIGPLPVDTTLPHKRIEWAGSYFPLEKEEEDDAV